MVGINYLVVNTTVSVDTSLPVLVAIPGTKEFRLTPTYANQVLPGHQVLMELGDSRQIAATMISDIGAKLEASVGEKRLETELQLESLSEDVGGLNTNNGTRARPFADYVSRNEGRISYDIVGKVQAGEELNAQEVNEIISSAYNALRKNMKATSEIKGALREYIRGGEANEQTLRWFAENVDSIFDKYIQYTTLNHELQQRDQNSDANGLEEALIQAIEAIKSGNAHQEYIEFGGSRINVHQYLQQLIGTEPKRQFLCRINEVVEGESTDGLIAPSQYKVANNMNVPEELKPYYIPIDKFGQIITLFDRALITLLASYADENQEIVDIDKEIYSRNGKGFNPSVLMRAVFPGNHRPTLTLYSDARIQITKEEEDVRRIMELIRNGREEIPRVVAKHFDIPEEQIKFEELISLQAQLMYLLPFPVYVCADTDSRMSQYIEEAKKQRGRLTPEDRILLGKYEINDRQLQKDFGVNRKKITNITETTLDEAMNLFGEEFGFIQKVMVKDG